MKILRPPLAAGGTESRQSRSQDGVFNRLRKTLSISRQSSKSLSAVVPFNSGSEEEIEKNHISVVKKTRAPHHQCVPPPPGFIPSEVLMKSDHVDQSVYSAETSWKCRGCNHFAKEGNQSPTAAAEDDVNSATNISSDLHKVKKGVRRVLYNNKVDPKFSHFPVTKAVVDC